MNVFFLDSDPTLASVYHGDKHVVKMILETAQMLSTAHRVLDGDERADIYSMYQATHVNHPSCKWVRADVNNYEWTHGLFVCLCDEFRFRRGKSHRTDRLVGWLAEPPWNVPDAGGLSHPASDPPQCMPEEFKRDDTVEAYRDYYLQKWRDGIVSYAWGRDAPDWLTERIERCGEE